MLLAQNVHTGRFGGPDGHEIKNAHPHDMYMYASSLIN